MNDENRVTIRARWDIEHDGRRIAPGEAATLPKEAASALIETGAAEALDVPEPPEPTDRAGVIAAAIGALEAGNPDHWTRSGKPEVRALERLTGLSDISAAERDAAYAAHRDAG